MYVISEEVAESINRISPETRRVGLGNVIRSLQQEFNRAGVAGGYAPLDSEAKVPLANMPATVFTYKGGWDAATNSPSLSDGSGTSGDTYRVTEAGTVDFGSGGIAFVVGDKAVYNGATWEKWNVQDETVTSPVAWTPTFTGFGSVTAINARSWRVGAELFFEITWTCGTPTGTEARVSLGFNGVDGSVTTASTYPTLQIAGVLVASGGFGAASLYTLVEASKTYIVFSGQSASSNGLSKVLGTAFTGSMTLSAKGSVRIQGW